MEREDLAARQAGLSAAKQALLERWKRGGAKPEATVSAIPGREEATPALLSPGQQRFWFLDQLTPGNPAYNVHALARLTGQLDRPALAGAFAAVVRRHEVLRTVFRLEEGEPFQAVLPAVDLALPRIDLSALPAERRQDESLARAREAAGQGFELGRPPLVRAVLWDLANPGEAEGDRYLLLVLHHAISDGWSMGVLLQELAAFYAAGASGRSAVLPPLPLQYADFAAWQRRRLAEGAFDADLAFWRQELEGSPESLELPTDRPRPAAQSPRGSSCPMALDPAATADLAALVRQQEATLFMALLALFATLLARYSGQRDLLLGSPVAGRGRRELEGLIGLFVNTVVLRGDLSGDPSFRTLLDRVRHTALAAYGHQELPFERLVEELHPDRDLGRNPLFQVMFVLQNTPVPEISLSRLTLRQEELESGTAMFDLAFSLRERAGRIAGALRYSTDLFDAATADRLLAHFSRLLAGAAAAPDLRLSELPLLTAEESRQLLAWNDTAVPFDSEICLHQRIEAWATKMPDALVVVCGAAVLSRGELDCRANRLARRLRRLGVGPEVPVGLCVGRSPAMLVGLLGILKAGGAYVPLDETYPAERLALMVEDARAPVLVTDGPAAGNLRAEGAVVLRLDADWAEIAREDGAPLSSQEIRDVGGIGGIGGIGLSSRNLAYVIYTSGSTGKPKGVGCLHLSAVNLVANLGALQPLAPGDACSLWTSISFDVSVTEIFTTLCCGGVLHVPADEERVSGETLLPWMARHRIVSAYLPPFMLAELAAWVRDGGEERRTLRRIWLGVEPNRESLLAEIRAAVPGLRIFNGYGPTEATVCDTSYDVGLPPAPDRRTPLGLPVGNCRIHLLDAALQEVPIGVPGEMWIAGEVLARGYLGRPDLTAERFVPDPVGKSGANREAGGRCYRTGDLARRLPSGDIEFLGRRDQQVKLRGFRIELEEVEAALALHPGVREAVVAIQEDPRGDKHLVAYAVPREEGADLSSWRELMSRRLPAQMVPATLVPLAALPLTPTGKVDRQALPAPDWGAAGSSGFAGPFVAPQGSIEPRLAAVWSELLGGGPISATDDFFARGGHSLLATRVVSRVRQLFAVELPLREIFEARTLAAMAARIAALRQTGREDAAASPVAGPRPASLPLSFAQQRLWFMDQFEPGNVLFNNPGALRLSGPLVPALLARTLNEVARRHEILRTSFRTADGQPVQSVAAEPALPLPQVDLSGLAPEVRKREAARWAGARPFDLTRGPMLRTTLLRLEEREHRLLLDIHHIVADRWSLGIFRREIGAVYAAFSLGEASPLPDLPLQYADFALWQRRWFTGEILETELAYWRRQLAGAPTVLELPTDRPRPAVRSFRGGTRRVALPAELVARLTRWGQERGGTLFMVLLAALGAVLGRASDQEDLLVGSPIAGRNHRQLEGLIGIFVNTLVLRVDLAGDPGFDLLLGRVRDMALDAYAHPALPFERLVDELAPVRDPSHTPLYQVAFGLQNVDAAPLLLPGLAVTPLSSQNAAAQEDLLLLVAEEGGALLGTCEYSADLFDATTIDRLWAHLAILLGAVAADAGRRLSDLPLLSPTERHQLRAEWNDTAADFPARPFAHEMLTEHARRAPDAVAVVDGERRLSFGELDARAGALARRLRAAGAGTEVAVALCAERSLELVLGTVAIAQSGSAYLPLDSSHPAERLAFMVEDSDAPVVLTQQKLAATLPLDGRQVLLLDGDGEPLPAPADPIPLAAHHPAYVIYTSGSTGRPKGVVVSHGALANMVRWHHGWSGLAPGHHATQVAGPAFDATVFEIWPCLAAGACLHVMDDDTRLSPPRLIGWLASQGITVAYLPTPLAEVVLDEPWPAGMALRALHTAGDRLHRRSSPSHPFDLWNLYGPTEATVLASGQRVAPARAGQEGPPAIGRPTSNARIHLLDRRLQPVPAGVSGELAIGGAGLARGYLARPDLTAERFVPDSLAETPGARLYRTGDLARWSADGELEFLGRADQQVKIRGLRIELGEIEAALGEHPAVQGSAVLVREDAPGEKVLVAYLVAREGGAPESAPATRELRAFLTTKLPPYMVPAAFVTLPTLPLTANGKVDRAALPAPPKESADREVVGARTPSEAILCRIWAQVLGREKVSVHDNFFELGGDSILCIQLVSRAQQAGLGMTVKDVFQHQTVAELAPVAVRLAAAASAVDEDDEGDVPLTPIERWFFEQDLADPHHFNQGLLLDLQAAVDPAAMERALARVVAHHAALRFRFERDATTGWRQSTAATEVPLVRLDLTALPQAVQRGALEAAAAALQESLDLTRGPLLRATHFVLEKRAEKLFLLLHHLIVDVVSWRVLLADLETAYRAIAGGGEAVLAPVPTSFRRWATRLSAHARSAAAMAELETWLAPARLAVRPLPVDHPGGDNTVASTRTLVVELTPEETTALLNEVPAAYHNRITDALLAALAQAVAGRTGEPRLLVDLEGHGREELFPGLDLSRAVGWFTIVYPVLLDLGKKRNPGEILKAVKEQLWAVPKGGIGYGLLRCLGEEATVERLRAMPAAQVLFNYLGQMDRGTTELSLFAQAGESGGPARSPRQRRAHLLEINGGITGGRLRLTWAYSENLHERRSVQSLADHFVAALRALIEHCRSTEAGGFTPSDFPVARVSQKDLDKLMSRIGKRAPGGR